MATKTKIHIGCSGWQYRDWIGGFYPAETKTNRMFEEYAKHFDTVEINSTFYHVPLASTCTKWKEQAPTGFVYAIKANRFITHLKRLVEPEEPIERFLERTSNLGKKLGVILFQFPPSFAQDLERLEYTLKLLPKNVPCTFEFRNKSWDNEDTYALLRKYNRAMCIYDLAGYESPTVVTADFAYIRLHGPLKQKYRGNYPDATLQRWAETIESWRGKLKHVYVYFDNDIGGAAPVDAMKLKELLKA